MTFLRLFIIGICIQLFLQIDLCADEVFFIRDVWTDQPIVGAEISTYEQIFISNDLGAFQLSVSTFDSTRITINKEGYFELSIKSAELITPFIYLTPIENTAYIMVVRSRESDSPLRLPSHISRIMIDESEINSKNNIADILADQNGIFMKSYGPAGSIQSISIRGMSPEQTQVLFDGVPMNSLQLGSVDMGYYPLQSIGSLEIYRGGNALFGGSGSIGGSIDMHPAPLLYDIGYNASSSYNSLDAFMFGGSIDLPFKTYRQRIFVNHAHALNDYTADYEGQSVSLENRDYQQISYGFQNAFQISQNISLNGFFNGYKREGGSPAAVINPEKEKENVARSKVENYLAKIRLDYNLQDLGLHLQGYFRDEQMEYKDNTLLINFESQHSVHKNKEMGIQFRANYLFLNKVLINSGIEGAWQKINSTDAGDHNRKRIAEYLLIDYEVFLFSGFFQSAHINSALRHEYFSNYGSVFLPGFGINIQGQYWQMYLTGSRNYRIPTFNELYWQPGGNSDLDSEESINFETGLEFKKNISRLLVYEIRAAFYRNNVENLIKWMPNGTIWSPQNISEVLSKGIEFETSVSDLAEIHSLSFNYRYGIAEKLKAELEGDETVGNQLPFLPREQYNVITRTGWHFLRMGINYSHVSFRYKTIDNLADQILSSYSIVDTWAGFEFDFKKNKIRISLAVENLFNENYQVMDGYPMPGRNYTFTLSSEY